MKKITLFFVAMGLSSVLVMAHSHQAELGNGKTKVEKQNRSHSVRGEMTHKKKIKEKVDMKHSGRTDAYGCHTNSITGEYHCH